MGDIPVDCNLYFKTNTNKSSFKQNICNLKWSYFFTYP